MKLWCPTSPTGRSRVVTSSPFSGGLIAGTLAYFAMKAMPDRILGRRQKHMRWSYTI